MSMYVLACSLDHSPWSHYKLCMDFKGRENRSEREIYRAVLRVSCLRYGWFHGGDTDRVWFFRERSPVERCFADLFGGSGGWMEAV